jgi:hypothetical protein
MDIKPENILICVSELFFRKLAVDATQWHKMGIKLPGSLGMIIIWNEYAVFRSYRCCYLMYNLFEIHLLGQSPESNVGRILDQAD